MIFLVGEQRFRTPVIFLVGQQRFRTPVIFLVGQQRFRTPVIFRGHPAAVLSGSLLGRMASENHRWRNLSGDRKGVERRSDDRIIAINE